ncbi:AraC family transcriptional regulator [Pseudoxanthomonas wuyuanensis]|uniref:Transcriptional regulator, AraC family n=1 Tax=Pseudoxanthomonas wuyuanensis TaxID=1073196 RepID=A0A286D2W1_9GAMM|nr:AraC family transcriptional regulator [Pseudoxanthomonas wuyuanensis]KAF1723061.1 AraC family transcriptional regulator [Pseudoxanthomonas wuyuanensis]SOD52969.1 transcriptional regulator, AraC family [Pseudoxanthomonas wuyuanensis]
MDVTISADELQTLFDALPDVVFFAKDCEGRYTHVNLTLVARLGLKHRGDVVGRTALELFPLRLGGSYMVQDRHVLCGEVIENQLEVHLFPNRIPGWCLTFKRPLCVNGEVRGLVGISRDLGQPDSRHPTYERLSRALEHMQAHYGESLRVQTLADLAEVSVSQLERHFRRVFQITPQQLLTKLRIEAAMRLLHGEDSIASIGLACGFADQSAFARQFKTMVGMTPRDYRAMNRSGATPLPD